MDYHSIHGHDVASFETTDYHRMPTVSASDALNKLKTAPNISIATGLEHLDSAIQGTKVEGTQDESNLGGVKRGQVTEIWGPPGTGVTTLGVQLAANAMRDNGGVVWVDCFQTVSGQRMRSIVNATHTSDGDTPQDENGTINPPSIVHYNCLTLPHLLALILRPTPKTVPPTASLIVLDSVSALINSSLPKTQDIKSNAKQRNGPTPSVKRRQALQAIMKALRTLALSKNCAVVLLSQCATKMQSSDRGATLTPAINATVWEQGVSTRIVLFRDWIWRDKKYTSVYLAGLQKLDGKITPEAVESISAFKMGESGIYSIPYDSASDGSVAMPHQKRKLGQTSFEIPDSEDEDYGWADEDEASLPAPPPQWQGSEDIFLGQEVGHSDDDEGSDAEDANSEQDTDSDVGP